MPHPEFYAVHKSHWDEEPDIAQWKVLVRLNRGWFWWRNKIKNCRLYLIRRDWGPLSSPPEGIWLKWICDGEKVKDLSITLEHDRKYEGVIAVRNFKDGVANIANETFIETNGLKKKFLLEPGRKPPINDPVGRYTFWLEVRSGKKKWRSHHFYALNVPPAGVSNDKFKLETLYD
jgi:hypothetical protein